MEKELSPEQEMDRLRQDVIDDVEREIDEYIEENTGCTRDDVRDGIDYDGRITELVDGKVPIYNANLMELATLSEVYHHENELPPAYDGTSTPINVTATAIYEILMEVAWETVDNYLDILEDEGKFEEE